MIPTAYESYKDYRYDRIVQGERKEKILSEENWKEMKKEEEEYQHTGDEDEKSEIGSREGFVAPQPFCGEE